VQEESFAAACLPAPIEGMRGDPGSGIAVHTVRNLQQLRAPAQRFVSQPCDELHAEQLGWTASAASLRRVLCLRFSSTASKR
jgi:hypothetical protein